MNPLVTRLREREGGWVNVAADRGGATKWGITISTLAFERAAPITAADIAALSWEEAASIYQRRYLDGPGISRLPAALQDVMLDFAVMSGPHLAILALQECLGVVKPDGVIGPITLAAAVTIPAPTTLIRIIKWRVMMIARICRRDPSQLVFLGGWLSRILGFLPEGV